MHNRKIRRDLREFYVEKGKYSIFIKKYIVGKCKDLYFNEKNDKWKKKRQIKIKVFFLIWKKK